MPLAYLHRCHPGQLDPVAPRGRDTYLRTYVRTYVKKVLEKHWSGRIEKHSADVSEIGFNRFTNEGEEF